MSLSSDCYKCHFFFIIVTLSSVFAFAEPDTYHYEEMYNVLRNTGEQEHFEDIYIVLYDLLPKNYYLWRFAIWGTATILFVKLIQSLNINMYVIGLLMPIVLLQSYVVSRDTLGIVLLFVSLSAILSKNENKLVLLMAIGGLVLSTFCHRLIFIYVILCILIIFIPMNKWTLSFSLIVFPVLYLKIMPLTEHLIYLYAVSEQTAIEQYLNSDKLDFNVFGMIAQITKRIAIGILLFFICRDCLKQSNGRNQINFVKFSYALFYISCLFLCKKHLVGLALVL